MPRLEPFLQHLRGVMGYQRPSPRMQGWVVTREGGFETCDLSFTLPFSLSRSLSHTLSFVRGVVQSVALERYLFLPFLAGFRDPSSEKLTGPVQFPVSSPLSRLNCCALVRKWVSLFGIYFPHCANVKHILPIAYVQSQNPEKVVPLHTHTCTYRGRGDQLFG